MFRIPILPRGFALPTAIGAALLSSPLASQMPPLTVPKGLVRFDFSGELVNYDRRYRDGKAENLAADFERDALGADFFPNLTDAEARIAAITGSAFQYNLGKSRATSLVNVGTIGIGLAYGLTSKFTVFATVPIVRVRVQPNLSLDGTDANAGFNPADPLFGTPGGQGGASLFLNQFGMALGTLAGKIQNGDYDASGNRAFAEQTLAQAEALRDNLEALLSGSGTAATFLPLASTPGGAALNGVVSNMQSILSTQLGVNGFSTGIPLPTAGLGTEEFTDYLTRQDGPVDLLPIEPIPILSRIGNIEVGVTYLAVDRVPETSGGLGIRLAAQGLVRLGTAILDSPNRLFDVGTGDRQSDLDLRGVADLHKGSLGVRLSGGYVLRLAGNQERRITAPNQPIGLASTLAPVRRNPGEIIDLRVSPFLRFTPTFALHGGVRYRRQAQDSYALAANQDPAAFPSVDLLGQESAWSATTVVAGLSFAHGGVNRRGERKLPMDAFAEVEAILSTTGGRVPDALTIRAGIRFYGRRPF